MRNTMNTQTLKKFRWFWAWQDEEEEAWLQEMSNNGWHLSTIELPGWYTFTHGLPVDTVYRLDYITGKEKNADYFLLFKDAGWDYIGELNGWQYFRQAVRNGQTPEIFSDPDSKARKYRRVIGFMLIFLPILMFNVINLTSRTVQAGENAFLGAISGFSGLLLLLYTYAIYRLWQRIQSLSRL